MPQIQPALLHAPACDQVLSQLARDVRRPDMSKILRYRQTAVFSNVVVQLAELIVQPIKCCMYVCLCVNHDGPNHNH